MPEWEQAEIDLPLRINGDRKHRTVIDHQRGKSAVTSVTVLEMQGVFTLLSAEPHTGYTHQIRAHLAAFGLPLLGDPLYKSLRPETEASRQAALITANLPIRRTALHAYQISFLQPAGPSAGSAQQFQAPYPEDFSQTLVQLREQL
jgi:23S rRNA-/tRNA-specific pseudouridylate synthase